MTKKIIALALTACVLLASPVYATQKDISKENKSKSESVVDSPKEELDSAMTIAGKFVLWADMFGVPDMMDTKPSYEEFSENTTDLFVDDLAIAYNSETSETETVSLFYDYRKCDKSHQIMKALAFFASVEYDAPMPWSLSEKGRVFEETSKIFNKMCASYEEKQKEIESGSYVAFYYSKCGIYYFTYDKKIGLMLSVKNLEDK